MKGNVARRLSPNRLRRTESKKISMSLREAIAGYSFAAPLMIGLSLVTIIPIIASFILSFTSWNLISGIDRIEFIGFKNFIQLFQDAVFMKSLTNNLLLLVALPFKLVIALVIAIVVDRYVYWKSFFKVVYFMPFISSIVAIAVVFRVLFHPAYGPINQLLMSIGIQSPPGWLADTNYALFSVIIVYSWIQLGFSFIIYLAGLQNVPDDLYEAADIDGAGAWQKFKNITVPMLSNTTFFLLITGIVGSFKAFDLIAVLTEGGPGNSTTIAVYYLYETAFVSLKAGYASTISLVIFIIILAITLINWYGQRKWVHN